MNFLKSGDIMQLISKRLTTDSPATLTGYIQNRSDGPTPKNWPAIIVVPGGSYTHIPQAQAETLALAFNRLGFQSFYLNYTTLSDQSPLLPAPIVDLARAVTVVKQNAADWAIDPNQVVIAGFSVGGHIVALYNDYWNTDWLARDAQSTSTILRPQAVLLGYPVISPQLGFPKDAETIAKWTDTPERFAAEKHVSKTNRPTFAWGTVDDPIVPAVNTGAYTAALATAGVDVEAHFFHHGPHGLALADATTAWDATSNNPHVAHWMTLFSEWYADLQS
ncbi:lipase esterase [Secundilactobacillus kimchicus JCM 15530]|uniref:Lipase esterase n=2 Tax=Secundilactobacillus kimchicus TaxID=528209 RepID=A0A0R1HR30_9LACO|nr:lipase esterase [Secundilactobacillus kimchicus JCM 15530]